MFRLLIESSKDITSLNINFADGTIETIGSTGPSEPIETSGNSQIQETPVNHEQNKFVQARDELLTGIEKEEHSFVQDKPVKPVIHDKERPAKVAQEIHNLDF